jgi:L-lactate dehydrogenase complex protein LldE
VPEQGCCGQPNFNSGDSDGACRMARRVIESFQAFDYVVVPSCSCAAMIKVHYPDLFTAASTDRIAADQLAEKTWELTAFLHEVAGVTELAATLSADVVLHDSCAGLRELGVKEQPRALLGCVAGLNEKPLNNPEVCCGFGGMFCIKYPGVSDRIAEKKLADICAAAPDALVSTDLGCLLHLEGKLHRDGKAVPVYHIAEVLAGTAGDVEDEVEGEK